MDLTPEMEAYIEEVRDHPNLERTRAGLPPQSAPFYPRSPRAAWYNHTARHAAEHEDVDEIIHQAREDQQQGRQAVCVIEAITWKWIGRLGHEWNIDPAFFADHGTNPEVGKDNDVWSAVFPLYRSGLGRPDVTDQMARSAHADGVFEYRSLSDRTDAPRTWIPVTAPQTTFSRIAWAQRGPYPPSCTTRLSYHRVHEHLYLILVDPPFDYRQPPPALPDSILAPTSRTDRSDTDLRMCFSGNRGGLSLPQLLDRKQHSLFQAFHTFFEHGWHFNVMFADVVGEHSVLAPSAFLHLVAASLWRANFRAVETEIKAISFRELHQPDMATNEKLHLLREMLTNIAGGTAQTNRHVPTHVREFYGEIYADPKHVDRMNFQTPMQQLAQLNEEAAELQRFLMDSFQLLISSVSVIETVTSAKLARISLEQASRGAKLTQLAFIYVPLSFVTSIFGMNIKEINNSPMSVWVCFVTLVIVVIATAAIFGGYELFERFWPKKTSQNEDAGQLSHHSFEASAPTKASTASADLEQATGKAGLWSP